MSRLPVRRSRRISGLLPARRPFPAILPAVRQRLPRRGAQRFELLWSFDQVVNAPWHRTPPPGSWRKFARASIWRRLYRLSRKRTMSRASWRASGSRQRTGTRCLDLREPRRPVNRTVAPSVGIVLISAEHLYSLPLKGRAESSGAMSCQGAMCVTVVREIPDPRRGADDSPTARISLAI